jgi:hypothetical protein
MEKQETANTEEKSLKNSLPIADITRVFFYNSSESKKAFQRDTPQ